MQFNEKLKKLRNDKGLTQAELADKVFVSRSAVAKWESGLGLPSDESLTTLAEFFGVEKGELLSDPETASVIINQNHTLSKQKLWIIALVALSFILIIVAAILIPLAVKNSGMGPGGDTPALLPEIVFKELIFETEINLSSEELINYPKDKLSVDKEFSPTRTFSYTAEESPNDYIYLPKLLIREVYNNGMVNYTPVSYMDGNLLLTSYDMSIFSYDEEIIIWVSCVSVPEDPWIVPEGSWCVNITLIDWYKGLNLYLSIKIIKNPVPVTRITISVGDIKEIGLTGRLDVRYDIEPHNATYQRAHFEIEKIEMPDGTLYEGNLSKYAYFENNFYPVRLFTTKDIELGSKIYYYAETEQDKVKSNTLCATVVRIPITYIGVNNPSSSVYLGGEFEFYPETVNPANATFNVLGEQMEVTLLTPELATMECKDGIYHVTATDDMNFVGEKIWVRIDPPEAYSQVLSWKISAIPIEEVIAINADTGEEIDESFTVTRGFSMRLSANVLPENATYTRLEYDTFSYTANWGAYIQIDDEGLLTVSDNAPFGLDVIVNVKAVGKQTPSKVSIFRFTVTKREVESIAISCETTELNKKEIYILSSSCYPADADIQRMEFSLLEPAKGIILSGNILYITDEAKGGTIVRIQAICDGVASNILELTVKSIPVERVILRVGTAKVVKGELYPLLLEFNSGADVQSIQFKLLDEVDGVYIASGQLFIAPTARVKTKFRIQAIVDGVESNVVTLEIVDSP